ncbi:MAG: IS66 family transposase [Thermoanaerobaculia bacterium]
MAGLIDCPGCAELRKELAILRAEIRDLRARLNQNSQNSSRPPSSDPPFAPARPSSPGTGRKPGGQPGHEGTSRRVFAPREVDEAVPLRPSRCAKCRKTLPSRGSVSPEPRRIQVVEIPEVTATVTEYVLEGVCCPDCGCVTHAEPPADVTGCVGPRLQSILAVLTGRYRGSRREVAEAVQELFGPKAAISVGWLSRLEADTAAALEPAYEQARRAVQGASLAHADETSFPEKFKKGWLWTASTADVVFFRHDHERSARAARRLLGAFRGVLVTDRWKSYRHTKQRRQICLAHLKRNWQALVDRGGDAARIGRAALKILAKVFELSAACQEGRIPFRSLRRKISKLRLQLFAVLCRGEKCKDSKAAGMSRDVLSLFPCIWTFTRHEGCPTTNNLAERRIRPAVLWRKGSFGTQSDRGSRFLERMLTVVQTLRIQGRSLVTFIAETIRNARLGRPPPRLLPDTG